MPLGRTQLARMPGLRPRQARIEPAPCKKAQGGHLFHREGADLPRLSHDEARDAAHGDSLLRGSLPPSARLPLRTYTQGQQLIANGLEERTRCCRHRTKQQRLQEEAESEANGNAYDAIVSRRQEANSNQDDYQSWCTAACRQKQDAGTPHWGIGRVPDIFQCGEIVCVRYQDPHLNSQREWESRKVR